MSLSIHETGLATPDGFRVEVATPAPLLHTKNPLELLNPRTSTEPHEGIQFGQSQIPAAGAMIELTSMRSRQAETTATQAAGLFEEVGSPTAPIYQGRPPEFNSIMAEIVFVLVCAAGQLIFAMTGGHMVVNQGVFRAALDIVPSQLPWLIGSSMLSSGLSVIIAGALADLAPPKPMMVGAFAWVAVWNLAAAFVIKPELKVLFFITRAMQGLAVGVVVSASMSILGRIYSPGQRKNRVFSLMAAAAPFGFWIGCVQGGALKSHLPWIFGSTAILLTGISVAAFMVIPPLSPAKDSADVDAPSLRQFDYLGALLASTGCGLVLFGLTQGSSAHWNPYTYSLIIVGFLMFVAFYFVERNSPRPLIPNGLWRTPGFVPLLVAYFLGYGGYCKFTSTAC